MVCLQAQMNNRLLSVSLSVSLSVFLSVCLSLVLTVSLKQVLTIQAQLRVCCWFLVKQKTLDKGCFFFLFPAQLSYKAKLMCFLHIRFQPSAALNRFRSQAGLEVTGILPNAPNQHFMLSLQVLRKVFLVITRCYGVSADS